MSAAEPIGVEIVRGQVLPEWIDLNGHMNVASYVTAFEVGVYALWERFGMPADYQQKSGNTTFAVETHTTYKRELGEGDSYIITAQVLAYDDKRVHSFLRMYDENNALLAATIEWLGLHVVINNRRVVAWPADVLNGIQGFVEMQSGSSVPAEAGRQIRLRKPKYSVFGEDS